MNMVLTERKCFDIAEWTNERSQLHYESKLISDSTHSTKWKDVIETEIRRFCGYDLYVVLR